MWRALGALLLWLATVSAPNPAIAGSDLMGLLGINDSIDRTIDGLQSLIDRAREAGFALEAQADNIARQRLEQVDKIVQDAISEVNRLEKRTAEDVTRILDKTTKEVNTLEQRIMSDLGQLIEKASCAGDMLLTDNLRDALGRLGVLFGTHTIEISPPVLFVGEQSCWFFCWRVKPLKKEFTIDPGFEATYSEIERYLLGRLDSLRNDTPVSSVLRTYSLLAKMANRATCLSPRKQAYNEKYVRYMYMIKQWEMVFGTQIGTD